MSLDSLTKEQKQYLVLGLIVAVALMVLVVFGIKVSLSSISEAKLELLELKGKIKIADRALEKRQKVSEDFHKTINALKGHMDDIPPDRNYYSWATEIIYDEARLTQLEIDAIDEMNIAAPPKENAEEKTIQLSSYSLRINAHGAYESVRHFLEQLRKEHPLVRVSGFEISSGSSPEIHDVQLFIQWPFNLGYITEAWENVATQEQTIESGSPASEKGSASGPASVNSADAETPRPKKMPVPPAPRPETAQQTVRASVSTVEQAARAVDQFEERGKSAKRLGTLTRIQSETGNGSPESVLECRMEVKS
jgi:hypothetical protein